MNRVARAFVPGHVTGFFTVDRDDDPTRAGSRGAGITLSEGVTVTVRRADEPGVALNGETIAMDAVDRVMETLGATVRVRGVTDLPLGAGFGVSGAMALGTALAVNTLLDRRLSENELVTIAHGAEVQAGSGLGDVVAQARGGVPIRLEPGGPHENVMDGIPARARIEYLSLGGLETADVIDGETDRLTTAGEQALSRVVQEPTLTEFMHASRRFSREAELLSPEIREIVTDVTEPGGEAAMAMLGRTVFALGSGLTDAGYDATGCLVHDAGAALQEPLEEPGD